MSSYTKSLPTEIWLNVFSMIKTLDEKLTECRLVCKAWKLSVESIMYKQIGMDQWKASRFELFFNHLTARPDLGKLVQEIILTSDERRTPNLYSILRLTPNLKIINGSWSANLVDQVFSGKRLSSLKLERLPSTWGICRSIPKLLRRHQDTLKSIRFAATEDMKITLPKHQFKNLLKMNIVDARGFQSVKELEDVLKGFTQVEELDLTTYTQTAHSKLMLWLAHNVEKSKNIKALSIVFQSDGLHLRHEPPRAEGPDWMEYLVFKCPNVEKLNIRIQHGDFVQHIIPPAFKHLKEFHINSMAFYDMEVLRRFVNTISNRNVHITWRKKCGYVGAPIHVCTLSAKNSEKAKVADFEIVTRGPFQHCDTYTTNTRELLLLFSTRTIKHWTITDVDNSDSPAFNFGSTALSNIFKCHVESLRVEFRKLCINEEDHLQQAEALENLEIAYLKDNFTPITQLIESAPNLRHLTFDNCSFTNIELAATSRLASLTLTVECYYMNILPQNYQSNKRIVFHIFTTICSNTQIFYAVPDKPLQVLAEQEYNSSIDSVIHIKCGSLQNLKVKIGDIRFAVEFDVDSGQIKSATTGFQESSCCTLAKEHKQLKSRYAQLEGKYSKAKEYLSSSQIESIEEI
ncbi:hypothetical protein MBANPS3_005038 [Mucor bainieri]